jgi:hypothetical protein
MMEKSAQPGEGGGALLPHFISYKVVVYGPTESTDTLPLFLLYPYMYSVVTSMCVLTYVDESMVGDLPAGLQPHHVHRARLLRREVRQRRVCHVICLKQKSVM